MINFLCYVHINFQASISYKTFDCQATYNNNKKAAICSGSELQSG